MQLNVIGEGEMGPGSQTSNNAGASKRELQRSEPAYKPCLQQTNN